MSTCQEVKMSEVLTNLNEFLGINSVSQVLMFNDDGVLVQFKDDSSMQLSPCGANFQYVRTTTGEPNLPESSNIIRQRCCFATSETMEKVEFALRWRNMFAKRPYVPSQFANLYDDPIHLHNNITCYQWPNINSQVAFSSQNKTNICVSAQDNYAQLFLCRNGHYCLVSHLVKLDSCTSSQATSGDSHFDRKNTSVVSDAANKQSVNYEQKSRREYVRMKHIFPVSVCPAYWKYPLALARSKTDSQHEVSSTLINVSHAPFSLPIVCKNQFQHTWHMNTVGKDIDFTVANTDQSKVVDMKSMKILWKNQVLYWINSAQNDTQAVDEHEKVHPVEAWLPDGSILLSTLGSSYYFSHLRFEDVNFQKKTQKMYSPMALPMDPTLKAVILRAIRLRSYTEITLNHSTKISQYCWHDASLGFGNFICDEFASGCSQNDLLNDLYEAVTIANLGKFSAVQGSIQIVYEDGTTIYVAISEDQLITLQKSCDALSLISCRLLLSNGQYMIYDNLLQPDLFLSPYLQPLVDWLLWLSKPKAERVKTAFYSDTIYSVEKVGMIASELQKISAFNSSALTSGKCDFGTDIIPSFDPKKKAEERHCLSGDGEEHSNSTSLPNQILHLNVQTPYKVASALKNTTQAISDIDAVMEAVRDLI